MDIVPDKWSSNLIKDQFCPKFVLKSPNLGLKSNNWSLTETLNYGTVFEIKEHIVCSMDNCLML